MKARRRFTEHKEGVRRVVLKPSAVSVATARTIYPNTVTTAGQPSRHQSKVFNVLKSGIHSRKVGSHVVKGRWRGMPIFTLTLEERATCPRACCHWLDCYGNKMQLATRWRPGDDLMKNLEKEVVALSAKYPHGFVVRLHVLGDFYSREYVWFWERMLCKYSELRIFGYTARVWDGRIGNAVQWLNRRTDRCTIRFSNPYDLETLDELAAVTIKKEDDVTDKMRAAVIVCPAQTGKTDCCGTCALCWETEKVIAFIEH